MTDRTTDRSGPRLGSQEGEAMNEQYMDGNDSLELTLFEVRGPQPRPTEELVFSGVRCAEDGNFEEAARIFEQVVSNAPDDPLHHMNLASAYQDLLASGDVEDAERAEHLTERACEHLLATVRLAPDFAPAYRSLGFVYKDMEAPWRAREMWNYYLEMEPHGTFAEEVTLALDELDRVQHLHRLCEEASHLVNHGDAERALRLLREVTEEEPSWYEAWFWSGLACRELEMCDEGIEAFAKAAELDPGSPYAYHELAALLARKGEREAAEGFWRKAIELDGDEPWIVTNLALMLWQEERRPEAEELLLRALDADPANRKLRLELRKLQAGEPAPPGGI